jgi:CHAT domain-containing protein
LNEGAHLYFRQGRDAEAEPLIKRSLAIYEKALGTDDPRVAVSLNNLGKLYAKQSRYTEAEPLIKRSLAINEKALGLDHPSVATNLNNLAALHESQGRYVDAYLLSRRAISVLEKRSFDPKEQDTTSQDSVRVSGSSTFKSYLQIASSFVNIEVDQTANVTAESFRAAQLATAADRTVALMSARGAAGTPALARIVRDRQDMIGRRNALETLLIGAVSKPAAARDTTSEEQTRRDLADVERKLSEIDEVLRRDFPSYAEIANPTPVDLPEAQKLLAPSEALVSFVVTDNAIFRFIVRKDRAEFREIKFKSADLTLQIEKLRRGLDLGVDEGKTLPQFDAATAHELYKILFADSASLLGGAKRLLIVPDAALTGLPFSVLLAKPATDPYDFRKLSWLVRDYAFSVLPSVGALKSLRVYATAGPPAPKPFIGFGDPILEGSPDAPTNEAEKKQAMRGPVANVSDVRQLSRLPEATKELKDIAAALGGDSSALYLQGTATERQLKTLDLSDYRVIAFATHALTAGEPKGYAEPALVLTPPTTGDETDDGLLSASEIMQLKLNADWVILSACNTAAADGTPGAPGLSGLARAFFYAGAKALLVSHWSVQTTMAARLTSDTVRAQQRDPSLIKPQALRQAMLAVLDDRWLPSQYRHPAFWAPFFIVGD